MIFINTLTPEEIITLEDTYKNHPLHLTRKRAHCLLLSNSGHSISEICYIYNICRQTVSILFYKWTDKGFPGLVDCKGRGRPCVLTEDQKIIVLSHVEKSPRSLKKVLADLEEEFGIPLSIDIIKNICKSAGLVWKRVRKSLRSKRDQVKFDAAEEEIKILIQQHKDGLINLSYFDGSGFTLEPCVPYAWQPVNTTIEIPSSKSKRINVLGFVDRDCNFDSFAFEDSVTSAVVVECLNWFADQIKIPTTLIIDNASMHTSYEFNSNIEDWKEKGLTIYRLPTYSPELNIIEIVWRKIKYEWLHFDAYTSYSKLKDELFNVLANIGITHKIEFV